MGFEFAPVGPDVHEMVDEKGRGMASRVVLPWAGIVFGEISRSLWVILDEPARVCSVVHRL
jgi:hypothetical protein